MSRAKEAIMPGKLSADEVRTALNGLPGWAGDPEALAKTFTFPDHIAAMGFVVRLAMAAEVMNHHPDLRIVYNRVELKLNSHDAGGVTDRDVKLARKADELAG
jgi:4a-hydroxytetrahydrobiopterin dehydratase